MLGIYDAGKSTLVHAFIGKKHAPGSTLGSAYFVHTHDGRTLNIWDTAGQERYAALLPMYTRRADVLIFAIDPTNIHSLSYLKKTVAPTLAHRPITPPHAIHVVVTKCDTQTDTIQCNLLIRNATKHIKEVLEELAIPNVFIRSFITSARTGKDADLPFTTGLDTIHENKPIEQKIDPLLMEPESLPARNTLLRCCPM
jgi:small GTP-binding protein